MNDSVLPALRVCIAGEGAMGATHLRTLRAIPGVEVSALCAGDSAAGAHVAHEWNIPFCSTRLEDCLRRDDVDAVIIATPSGLHVEHGLLAAAWRKPCLIEIPAALSLAGSLQLAEAQASGGAPMMIAQTRRFSPAHRHLREGLRRGEFKLHHLVAETYFLRRSNLNMFGQPRSWTDNLLWHHACHTVDLAAWLLDDDDFDVVALQGPPHPGLSITMDLSIAMRSRRSRTLVTMALSFNNKGPFGGFYRYIGEEETYRVFRDELSNSEGQALALEGTAFERQDREFVDAIRSARTPESDIHSVVPSMRLLHRIEAALQAG